MARPKRKIAWQISAVGAVFDTNAKRWRDGLDALTRDERGIRRYTDSRFAITSKSAWRQAEALCARGFSVYLSRIDLLDRRRGLPCETLWFLPGKGLLP